tara:strand:- start:1462 stop:1824 length:363 start_codon:yes stop_codon:yes gene_type:complete
MAIGDITCTVFSGSSDTLAPASQVQVRIMGLAINYGSTGCEWRIKTTTGNTACQLTNESSSAKGGNGVVMISGADGDTGSGGMNYLILDGSVDGGMFLECDGTFSSNDRAWAFSMVVKTA